MEKHLQIWASGLSATWLKPRSTLAPAFGVVGVMLHQFAHGEDGSPVDPHSLDR
jgi:hypothetical protein